MELTYTDMNTISLHVTLAIAGAIVIATYILFGDVIHSTEIPKRKKRRKGIVPGLANIGNSCFLNCILQALASCPSFRKWLDLQETTFSDSSLVSSLKRNMITLSNEGSDSDSDARDVLHALKDHGWVISSEEQDAHELFHALTSTIDDELAIIRLKSNSLLDLSWLVDKKPSEPIVNAKDAFNESDSLSHEITEDTKENKKILSSSIIARVPSSLKHCLSSGKESMLSESPFKGHLASRLQCTICGLKNSEQWSSFESLSLPLPGIPSLSVNKYSLQDLLHAFIRPECVSEVVCDSCSKLKNEPCRTTFTKQLTIGKLPECLCMHIQRTVWLGNGYAVKRKDHILIPEIINMDPYTYTASLECELLKGRLIGGRETPIEDTPIPIEDTPTPIKDTPMPTCVDLPLTESLSAFSTTSAVDAPMRCLSKKQTGFYKLQSVVVHVGDVLSGHFMTYRRGSAETSSIDRWFYTSDLIVREVTLQEVLQSNAYMIIYERCLL